MKCERCHGTGWVVKDKYGNTDPCADCMGSGLTYCCEGPMDEPKLPSYWYKDWDAELDKRFPDGVSIPPGMNPVLDKLREEKKE